jgi:phosphate transport system permease protein
MRRLSLRRRVYDRGLRALLTCSGGLTCALLIFLIGYVFYRGLRGVTWSFLTTGRSYLANTIGILPNIFNTLYLVFLALAMALPLGVGAAIYLTEYARRRRLVAVMEFAAETLAGVPSILFGLVGLLVFVRLLGLGRGVLAGGLTLVGLALPTILRTSQEALKTVPQAYREGALALGAGQWRTVYTVVLPSAVDGIVTGCILAAGRMVGESAALLFTAGMGMSQNGFFRSLTTPSAPLSVALYLYATEYADVDTALAIAAVLMVLSLGLNTAAGLAGRRLGRTP